MNYEMCLCGHRYGWHFGTGCTGYVSEVLKSQRPCECEGFQAAGMVASPKAVKALVQVAACEECDGDGKCYPCRGSGACAQCGDCGVCLGSGECDACDGKGKFERVAA